MNPKFFRIGNRVINLSEIAEVKFEPGDEQTPASCTIWYTDCIDTTLTGAEAEQFWALTKHYSMNITPVESVTAE